FGHGKVENISGTVEALLIFLASGWIIYEAAGKLLHPREIEAVGWGVVVMFVSSVVNIIVSKRLFKVGRATCSVALQADAWHLRTDVYTSAGVMAGLIIILAGSRLFPGVNLLWLDPLAAIAVALLIIRAAWHLTLESAKDLLDVSLPEEEAWIREYIAGLGPSIRGIHHLHTRKNGALRFVEFHLIVEKDLSVADSHRLTDIIDDEIETHFPGTRTTIHVEPCDGICDQTCLGGCLLSSDQDISATDNRSKPE
ncbi:MAG: cation diffusion facilitator family transporter, partial [bacterium]|nr:cation diffusion facilitator family transporter [bacterium]